MSYGRLRRAFSQTLMSPLAYDPVRRPPCTAHMATELDVFGFPHCNMGSTAPDRLSPVFPYLGDMSISFPFSKAGPCSGGWHRLLG
jgi:hypothetical protein